MKMLAAATKVKIRGSEEKMNRNTYDISYIKRVTRKFQEISRFSRAVKGQKCTKKCAARAKLCFFWLIRPTSFLFGRFRCRRR